MTTKSPLQKTLQRILHTENESKQNHECIGSTKQQKKRWGIRVTLIQLHTIKHLNNKNNQMTGITTYISILTLSVNALNSPIKRHHLANWIKKVDPTICWLQETHLIDKKCTGLEWKLEEDLPRQWHQGSNTYLGQSRLQAYMIKRNKEGHFILIKGEIYQKEITIINLYAPSVTVPSSSNILWRTKKHV
jgi:hypothetical protein